MTRTADVVIVGGGVVGSAAAWRLLGGRLRRPRRGRRARSDLRPRVVVPGHGRHPPAVRVAASCVQMVQHSVRLWREFDERMRTPSHAPRAWFRQRGYLFLADDATSAALAARADAQQAAGAVQQRLSVDEIAALVPGLKLDDIRWGLFGPEDGYANPREVLFGLRAAAVAAGAEYVARRGDRRRRRRRSRDRRAARAARAGSTRRSSSTPPAPLSGRVAALAGARRPGRAGAAAAVPLHAAPPLADAVSDGRRPRRRALASRRRGRARRARSHHPGLHQVGRAGRRVLRLRRGALGARSSTRRWCGGCRRWPTCRTCTAGPGLYEMTPDHNPVLGEHPAVRRTDRSPAASAATG